MGVDIRLEIYKSLDEFTVNCYNNLYDLVLVCGPYKTGTSLITCLLEQRGYFNPAGFNNQHEHGNGLSQRYMTKECVVARKINKEILYDASLSNFDGVLTPLNISKSNIYVTQINAVRQYISELPSGSVVKDPQFTYTLYLWLEACRSLKKTVNVYFTERTEDILVSAWNEAHFTKSLLSRNKSALANMTKMNGIHQYICHRMNKRKWG